MPRRCFARYRSQRLLFRGGRQRSHLRRGGAVTWTLQPVEPVGAEQDEVDQQRQDEQEEAHRDEHSPRIEQKPNSPHVPSPLKPVARWSG